MIDIHSHILPMVDDGFQSIEQSLTMLKRAYQEGSDEIILTPHLAYPYGFINPYDKINELFHDFKHIVKQERIPIQLHLGCEFLFDSPASFIEHFDEITKINGTQYILMEFFFDVQKEDILAAIDTVVSHHLIPIIAHPERYESIQISNDLAYQCVQKGALLQMNKGSVFQQYGIYAKEAVLEMLDHHLIHFIGSDAHSLHHRNALMYDDYCFIKDNYGREYAQEIFKINPKKMLENEDIRRITR